MTLQSATPTHNPAWGKAVGSWTKVAGDQHLHAASGDSSPGFPSSQTLQRADRDELCSLSFGTLPGAEWHILFLLRVSFLGGVGFFGCFLFGVWGFFLVRLRRCNLTSRGEPAGWELHTPHRSNCETGKCWWKRYFSPKRDASTKKLFRTDQASET